MKRIVIVAAMLALSAGAVVAQQDQVKKTQGMMKDNGKNAGALAAILKGEKPYDQATVNAALAQFEDTAKQLPTLFPESMKGVKLDGDYTPSPKIWEDKAGFAQQAASFAKAVADAKGKIKDVDTLKAELGLIGKQCGGCHETYRIKKG
ncbi:c-type cytochrome [Bradyrhizobium septentrionale]|uniref:Cytochrome c n=1 Tax=Bradyrhizobium septentrionale TaxID=1404411 RepID=A0A973W4M2_9BRAD|nr:cytochrome c [Bradyrhizobium septentrionale]UGY15999.1 cytochrome c [Bradyrhizobium septentrionale]UGY24573.1 cytochrome c [Bradyrhizobium septentrionale]